MRSDTCIILSLMPRFHTLQFIHTQSLESRHVGTPSTRLLHAPLSCRRQVYTPLSQFTRAIHCGVINRNRAFIKSTSNALSPSFSRSVNASFFCLLPLYFSCRLSLPLSLWLCSDYSCCRDLVPLFYSLKSHLVCFYLSLLLIESLLTGSFWSVL